MLLSAPKDPKRSYTASGDIMSAAAANVGAQIGARTDTLEARIDALKETTRARLRLLRVILGLQTASLVGAVILLFRT